MLGTLIKLVVAAVATAQSITMIRVGAIDFSENAALAAFGVTLVITAVVLWINLGIAYFRLCRKRPVIAFLSGIAGIGLAAFGFGKPVQEALGRIGDADSGPADVAMLVVAILALIAVVAWMLGILQSISDKQAERSEDRDAGQEKQDEGEVVEFPGNGDSGGGEQVASSG